MRPLRCRLETPAPPGAAREQHRGRSHHHPTPRGKELANPSTSRLARTHPGSRGASPDLPRRRSGSAAPEVPFIGEPGGAPESAPRPAGCPQSVANLWTMSDAFFDLTGSAALDGAAATRPDGASSGGNAPLSCLDGPKPAQNKRAPSAFTDFCDQDDPRLDTYKPGPVERIAPFR